MNSLGSGDGCRVDHHPPGAPPRVCRVRCLRLEDCGQRPFLLHRLGHDREAVRTLITVVQERDELQGRDTARVVRRVLAA